VNPAYLHLILSHVPIVGIGFVILLFIISLVRKSNELINISLVFVILMALFTLIVHKTGESAEEFVKDMPGFSNQVVLTHDVAADLATIVVQLAGLLALITLAAKRFQKKHINILVILTLLALIIAGGLVIRAAYLGGKINHPEIQSDNERATGFEPATLSLGS